MYLRRGVADISGVTVLRRPAHSLSVYLVYNVLAQDRDQLHKRFRQEGVSAPKVHLRNELYTVFGIGPENLPGVAAFA